MSDHGHEGVGRRVLPNVALGQAGLLTLDARVTNTRPPGLGVHGMFPTRRKLQAIFYAAGPGVAAGRRLGVVRSVDVGPTVAALLGIPPPANATGRPLPISP
ncbi:MAG: hypothetical protein HYS05_19380 [Acidobacteria bacterium]|nr:hypothetical protein [Acidobacteriota bacterium]